jgi:ABC-type transport system involved in multi-copper enzyme maturation permease subunit
MTRLLKFEFRKLFTGKSTYILFAIMAGMSVLSVVVQNFSVFASLMLSLTGGSQDAMFAATNTLSSSNFEIVIAIFVAIFVCSDYDLQTNKNILSRGFTKSKVFFAKLIVVFTTVIVELVLLFAINFFTGWWILGFNTSADLGVGFERIGVMFVMALAETALFFAISVLLRKTGGAIALNIVAPVTLFLFFMLFDNMAKIDGFTISEYWFTMMQTNTIVSHDLTKLPIYAIVCGSYILLFLIPSYFAALRD